jgi:D-glucosaminate-6-phosphate ammonia-lyase
MAEATVGAHSKAGIAARARLTDSSRSAYDRLGVPRAINACGIYTELGGSCLSTGVWEAASEVNAGFASMSMLLEQTGEQIAELLEVEAARVVPGAAAGIALSVGACISKGDGRRMEQLPDTTGMADGVVMQGPHRYKYDRCARIPGGRIVEVASGDRSRLQEALDETIACVLHPAHLDGVEGSLPLADVAVLAHNAGIPVVVDAAYMSYPTDLIASYGEAGADLVCISAKYFWGPNVGGFVYGRRDLVDAVATIDFTGFEGGPYLIFGRPFKMDRTSVAATVLALAEWLELDHERRWAGYGDTVERLGALLADVPAIRTSPACFTLDERLVDEPVNALVVRAAGGGTLDADRLAGELAAGSPSIHCIPMKEALVFCVETVFEDEVEQIAGRVRELF